MRERSLLPLVGLSLALVLGACSNGGKNQRNTTGMTPGSAAGQVGGAGATTSAAPAMRDSTDCRKRDPNCRRP